MLQHTYLFANLLQPMFVATSLFATDTAEFLKTGLNSPKLFEKQIQNHTKQHAQCKSLCIKLADPG